MNKELIQAVEAMRVHPERPGKHWVRTLTDAQRKSFIAGGTFVLATLPVSEVKSGEILAELETYLIKRKDYYAPLKNTTQANSANHELLVEILHRLQTKMNHASRPANGQDVKLREELGLLKIHCEHIENTLKQADGYIEKHQAKDFASHPVEPSQPLKELSQITDEDAIEVARLMLLHSSAPCTPKPHLGRYWLDQVFAQGDKGERFNSKSLIQVIDFLRFRNYNIPNQYTFAPANVGVSVDWEKVREEIGTGLAKVHWAEWEAWHPGCVTWQEMTPEHQKELLAKEKSAATFCANYLKSHLNVAGEVVEWASVEDRLPENGFDCIIWDENKGMPLIASYDHMQSMWRDNFQDMYEGQPTHWKPLNLTAPAYTK